MIRKSFDCQSNLRCFFSALPKPFLLIFSLLFDYFEMCKQRSVMRSLFGLGDGKMRLKY